MKTIPFPTAGGKYLESMTACGRIKSKYLKKTDKAPVRLHAPLKDGGRIRLVISTADDKKDVHFHIDISKASYFRDEPPAAKDSLADVIAILKRFLGKPIDVIATGRFALPLKKLGDDSLVRLLLKVPTKNGAARLIGALFESDCDPISWVRWNLKDADDEKTDLLTVVETIAETEIGGNYFDILAAPLQNALRTMVLEEMVEAQ